MFNLTRFEHNLSLVFDQIEEDQSEALAIEIAANFVAGQAAGEKHKSMVHGSTMEEPWRNHGNLNYQSAEPYDTDLTDEEKTEIAALVALYAGYISEFNTRAQAQILARVKEITEAGGDQAEIKQYLDDIFSGKESIVIDNTGQERKEIYVDENLKLSEVTRTVEKPFFASVLVYASMLGENASHASYEKGREASYKAQGFDQWVFTGPADEVARAHHVVLLGEVFEWGTQQSEYAEQCLHEPHCRHKAVAYKGDGSDVSANYWRKLKEDVGLFWNDSLKKWDMKINNS